MSRVCDFIKNEVPMDKGFRMKDLKAVAEVVLKFYGREVQPGACLQSYEALESKVSSCPQCQKA
jgi:hypothetical protein